MNNRSIITFLRGEGVDNRGRVISDIWSYSYERLEDAHDYIQWLFPLFEKSAYFPDSPTLTIDVAEQIAKDEICRSSLNHSLSTMRAFYGNNSHWARLDDHNLLRITRIIKSSALLLGETPATEFYNFVVLSCDKLGFKPSGITIDFWNEAKTARLTQYSDIGSASKSF